MDTATATITIEPETAKEAFEQYAESVRKYLIKRGVAAERMDAKGYGEEVPIADNRTKDGRDQNRRVEFVITSQ